MANVPNTQGANIGIATAVAHSNTVQPNYLDQAELVLLHFFRGKYGMQIGWDRMREYVENKLGDNQVPMSWGGLSRRLTGAGRMRDTGMMKKSVIGKTHGRKVPIYEIR